MPAWEMLLIINENLLNKYKSSKRKPSDFARENITFNKKKYDKSSEFIKEYYGGKRIDNLVQNLKEYKRIKKHKADECYLADLLK